MKLRARITVPGYADERIETRGGAHTHLGYRTTAARQNALISAPQPMSAGEVPAAQIADGRASLRLNADHGL